MFDLLTGMGDDQLALTGCLAALLTAGMTLWLGNLIGRQRDLSRSETFDRTTVRLKPRRPVEQRHERAA